MFFIPLEVKSHKVPHLKALRYGKCESRGLYCYITSNVCHDVLKSDNLLHCVYNKRACYEQTFFPKKLKISKCQIHVDIKKKDVKFNQLFKAY